MYVYIYVYMYIYIYTFQACVHIYVYMSIYMLCMDHRTWALTRLLLYSHILKIHQYKCAKTVVGRKLTQPTNILEFDCTVYNACCVYIYIMHIYTPMMYVVYNTDMHEYIYIYISIHAYTYLYHNML